MHNYRVMNEILNYHGTLQRLSILRLRILKVALSCFKDYDASWPGGPSARQALSGFHPDRNRSPQPIHMRPLNPFLSTAVRKLYDKCAMK